MKISSINSVTEALYAVNGICAIAPGNTAVTAMDRATTFASFGERFLDFRF